MFWLDAELGSQICLDGIVTVVDAKNCLRQLNAAPVEAGTMNEAVRQIATADRIIVNKVCIARTTHARIDAARDAAQW
jgi:G3E family GTPase